MAGRALQIFTGAMTAAVLALSAYTLDSSNRWRAYDTERMTRYEMVELQEVNVPYDALGSVDYFETRGGVERNCPYHEVHWEYGPRNSTIWRCNFNPASYLYTQSNGWEFITASPSGKI